MSKHSPTPWVATEPYDDGFPIICAKDGSQIATLDGDTPDLNDANARLIVEAVNDPNISNGAEMRKALRFVASTDEHGCTSYDIDTAIELARRALKAPARNCDMFSDGETAFSAFFCDENVAEKLESVEKKCSPEKLRFALACYFADWLFAPAKEGETK